MWIYSQSSGHLFHDDTFCTAGYSGFGIGKNNPSAQNMVGLGPIPCGTYVIGPAETHAQLGPLAMTLTPADGNEMFGRSEFLIHGDSLEHPGAASHGCIILERDAREQISTSGDNNLTVEA